MSSFRYCKLDEAKAQLRIVLSDTSQDAHIDQLILSASAMVKNYMGDKSVYMPALDDDDEPLELDSNYEPVLESFDSATKDEMVRPEVKQAVLILVSELYRFREGDGNFDGNYLPATVRAILYPLRDPAI